MALGFVGCAQAEGFRVVGLVEGFRDWGVASGCFRAWGLGLYGFRVLWGLGQISD